MRREQIGTRLAHRDRQNADHEHGDSKNAEWSLTPPRHLPRTIVSRYRRPASQGR